MLFIKIREAQNATINAQQEKDINNIKALTDETLRNNWYYWGKLTERQKAKDHAERIEILIKKTIKEYDKRRATAESAIIAAENAPDLLGVNISVEWKRNSTWGANPTATADIHTTAGWERTESKSISGCGYDKGSTAVAEALNKSASIKKMLYTAWEKALTDNPGANMRDVLGYGSGYDCKPYFEGGVGVSCYSRIFAACGFNWSYTASGKMFDCYGVTAQSAAAAQ